MASADIPGPITVNGSWRPVRLATLVGLRWLAIVGQAIGVLFVEFGLGFPMPLAECLMLISLSVLLNLWLVLWPHQKKLLGFVPATLEERVRCSRITFLSSRSNTILSFPLLFLMASGGHGLHLF